MRREEQQGTVAAALLAAAGHQIPDLGGDVAHFAAAARGHGQCLHDGSLSFLRDGLRVGTHFSPAVRQAPVRRGWRVFAIGDRSGIFYPNSPM